MPFWHPLIYILWFPQRDNFRDDDTNQRTQRAITEGIFCFFLICCSWTNYLKHEIAHLSLFWPFLSKHPSFSTKSKIFQITKVQFITENGGLWIENSKNQNFQKIFISKVGLLIQDSSQKDLINFQH